MPRSLPIRVKTAKRRSGQLALEVCQRLRQLIICEELQPGDRLVESEIADRLQVSRTPVREALQRLVSDGWVAEAPRKGYIVATFSPEFIIDNYAVREVLEGLSAELASRHASELELVQMEVELDAIARANRQNDITLMAEHNVSFQMLIAKASRNVVLNEVISTLQDRLRLLRASNFSISDRREEALKEQRALLNAIKARDGEAAGELARLHVRNARQVRLTLLFRRGR